MTNQPIPVSTATNAFDLLDEIADLILAEPRRYYQGDWLTNQETLPDEVKSPCGTTACVAGWVCTLKAPAVLAEHKAWERARRAPPVVDVSIYTMPAPMRDAARKILGVSVDDATVLFDGQAAGSRCVDDSDWSDDADDLSAYDLAGHAERGAAHIRAFMTAHETQLKATPV